MTTTSSAPAPARTSSRVPGVALSAGIAVVATVVGRTVPFVGAPVIAIVLGVVVAAVARPGARFRPGIRTASTTVLQCSVVLLGAQLSLGQIARVGLLSLPVMVGTLGVCLLAAWGLGRRLGVVGDLRTLIGVGTGICGASAIAAVTPVIGAVGTDVAYAVSTIFVFNVGAALLFPPLGHLLGLSQHAFGLFAGTAVNDMSSVVATSATYGAAAARFAVVVKLVRTLMIIPVCLGLAAWSARRDRSRSAAGAPGARVDVVRLVPWFLVAVVVAATATSFGLAPAAVHPALGTLSVLLITVALAAIGLSTDLAGLRRAGLRPVALGGLLWLVVSLTSLGLQLVVAG